MHNAARFRLAGLALAAVTIAACADGSVVSPELRKAGSHLAATASGSLTYIGTAKTLHRDRNLQADEVDSVLLSPDRKSVLTLGQAGLKLEFPKGAVAAPMWVKAVALRGPKIYYEFYPSPHRFLLPVTVTQDLRDTKAYRDKTVAEALNGAYLPEGSTDISGDGTAQIGEIFATTLVPDKSRNVSRFAIYQTNHFSGYILAVGFKSFETR